MGLGLIWTVSLSGAQPAVADEGHAAPAIVSEKEAIEEAKKTGSEVEVVSQRRESREVFAIPQGNFPGTIDDVRAFDRVMASAEANQLFGRRPLAKGRWNFETVQDGTPATTPHLSAAGTSVTLGGQARRGMGWVDLGGLELDGTAVYAATNSRPLDTSAGFTMTAWAQAAAIPDSTASVVSAAGTHTSAFGLRFEPDEKDPAGHDVWAFRGALNGSQITELADSFLDIPPDVSVGS
ncbi:hypothetical protein JHN53_11135 [Streptomyces sp. MBT58]|uniref:hypothetical protein n=1 Tax=Streptomyces sp. MBT58 TaxID=1488389 RepID=UPI0019124FEA|nr:hypothetical protein [Streptomyces sp. MBT58]MBK5992186.1 hypothetical protein [Streptomyces sp. MBT58]